MKKINHFEAKLKAMVSGGFYFQKLHRMQGAVHGSGVYSGACKMTKRACIHISVVKLLYLYKSDTRLISAKRARFERGKTF